MKKKRIYRFVDRRKQKWLTAGIILCAAVFAVCAFLLIRYAVQYRQAGEASQALQEIYHAEEIHEPLPTAAPAHSASPVPTAVLLPAATPLHAAETTPAPWQGNYPLNPYLAVRSPFTELQKKNPDIIGWLTAEGLLDQAVVQRDNEYYLKRDYLKKSNDNGALFLDEACSLRTRPPFYMIYGHNMKSGAMFGALHSYGHLSYYKQHPLLTFNTQYEEGTFVIFSVCDLPVSTLAKGLALYRKMDERKYLDFIREIQIQSLYSSVLPMNEQDQLLLLVTCTGDDNSRRVVAARRLRDTETAQSVTALIGQVRSQ